MKLNWNFQGGWGGLRKNPFHEGGMDIFWNYTIWQKEGNVFLVLWAGMNKNKDKLLLYYLVKIELT